MIAHRRVRAVAAGAVLLSFAGLWLGHTVEYLRVWGTAGFTAMLTNPVHAYMLPFAAILTGAGALVGLRAWRAWQRLGARLDRTVASLARLWRGHRVAAPVRLARPSPARDFLSSWIALAATQIVLYLAQENLEALAVGQQAPGWGAVTGVHWAAPLVHAGVALLLVSLVRLVQGRLRRRAAAVRRVEDLIHALARRLERGLAPRLAPPDAALPPLERFGPHLWCRPPPLPA